MIIREQKTIIHNRLNLLHKAFESKKAAKSGASITITEQIQFNAVATGINLFTDGVSQRVGLTQMEFITLMSEVQATCLGFERDIAAI